MDCDHDETGIRSRTILVCEDCGEPALPGTLNKRLFNAIIDGICHTPEMRERYLTDSQFHHDTYELTHRIMANVVRTIFD